MQTYTSKKTALPSNSPRSFTVGSKMILWKRGIPTVNLDMGGGTTPKQTEALAELDCENIIVDPYNVPEELNKERMERLKETPADTATISNVLNVIDTKEARMKCVADTLALVKDGGVVIITVHVGTKNDRKEGSRKTPRGWQNFKTVNELYLPELQELSITNKVNFVILKANQSTLVIKKIR